MEDALAAELALHLSEPFPASVEKGTVYGAVEPVMVDADIYGWASRGSLGPIERRSLREAADQLARSLDDLPPDALPYFQRLVRIARMAAAAGT